MMPSRAALPPCSFAEIAADLTVLARREAGAAFALEVFAARYPGETAERVLAEARAQAERAGRAATAFGALAPLEAAVRALARAASEDAPAGGAP